MITGIFTDEVDPNDPRNSVITDIALGPKNADGTVSFTADFQIIRPTDLSKAAHRVMYDLPNRGGPGALSTLNGGITAAGTPITAGGNTAVPPSAGTAGTGFLMNMGWSIVEVGWDLTAPQGGKLFGLTLPVATNKNGSAITGPTTEELDVDLGTTPADLPLTYPPASLDQSKATLTVRENYGDKPQVVPAADWDYTTTCTAQADFFSPTCVKLTAGNFGAPGTFGPTALYEFTYIAQNPNIAGLGLAAIRDFATFLRDAKTDDNGAANPLGGDVKDIYTICSSQPCRTTRDFVLFGFNDADVPAGASQHKWGDRSWWSQFWLRPPHHEKAIDGMLNYIGGGDGIYLNYRFAQPTRTSRQHIARWDPEFQFPFADVSFKDRVTHETGGRLERCEATDTCPKIFETNSENEFWSKGGSMLTTDGQGHDLDLTKTPERSLLRARELPARHRKRHHRGHLPATAKPAQFGLGREGAAGRSGRLGEQRHGAAGKPGADYPQPNAGARLAAIRHGLSEHPERQLGDELQHYRPFHLRRHRTGREPVIREPGAAADRECLLRRHSPYRRSVRFRARIL